MSTMHTPQHDRPDEPHALHPDDARLLDRLMDVGLDPAALEGLTGADRRRAAAAMAAFQLLDDYPVGDAETDLDNDTLIHAALARIQRSEDAATARRRIIHHQDQQDAAARRFRIRVPDLFSMAAIILIGLSVMWPIVGEVRSRSIEAGCVANLTSLGTAFASYSSDYSGRVPVVAAGWTGSGDAGAQWLDPLPLVQMGYCDRGHINCPGHPSASQPSYSRQLMLRGDAVRWQTGGARPVMGDRNPVIDARLSPSAEYIDPKMNSINHGKRGQNVLNMDGSVSWLEVPVVGSDDNIWLIRGQNDYRPGLVPSEESDIYLVQ